MDWLFGELFVTTAALLSRGVPCARSSRDAGSRAVTRSRSSRRARLRGPEAWGGGDGCSAGCGNFIAPSGRAKIAVIV